MGKGVVETLQLQPLTRSGVMLMLETLLGSGMADADAVEAAYTQSAGCPQYAKTSNPNPNP